MDDRPSATSDDGVGRAGSAGQVLLQTVLKGPALRELLHRGQCQVQAAAGLCVLTMGSQRRALLGASVFAILAIPAQAAGPVTWKCSFEATTGYRGGNETVRSPNKFGIVPEKLELTFIDAGDKAYVVGNNGSNEVVRLAVHPGGVQFVERVGSGALQVTAIDSFGNAVHSRHTQMAGQLLAAQHYGRCTRQ
jgi:hypothetical protein